MSATRHRPAKPAPAGAARDPRPVMLVTLDVPFADAAVELAVDAAVESGSPLLVVNVVATAFLPATLAGWDYVVRPEVEDSLRRPCELAPGLGVRVERLRVRSPHPLAALLELMAERRPGLLVFGADRSRVSRRVYRKAQRALEKQEHCLVWIAGEW